MGWGQCRVPICTWTGPLVVETRQCQRREHLGFLLSFRRCRAGGEEVEVRSNSCQQSSTKNGVSVFISRALCQVKTKTSPEGEEVRVSRERAAR